ncbi:MAG: M48 family metalloprotease [Armatimonadia bacterium]
MLCTGVSAHVGTEFEEALGKLAMREMVSRNGLVETPLLQAWVQRIGGTVAAQSSRSHLRYRFFILDSSESNAFSLPGGYIVVTMGLLTQASSDEELAGVIGHEVAHSDDHDFLRLLRQQAIHLGLQSLLRREVNDEWVMGAQFFQILDTLRASRRHEMQADIVGVELAFAARYDPQGHVDFLRTVQQKQSGADKLFATHPPGEQRVAISSRTISELEVADYPGMMALADSLRQRWHWARAAEQYAQTARLHQQQAEPLLRLGQLEEERGRTAQAAKAYEGALARSPDLQAAQAGLTRTQARVEPPLQTVALPQPLREQVGAAAEAVRAEAKHSYEAEKRLHAALKAFDRDYEIAAAMQTAQVIAPETNDAAYLATVARAYYALARAQKEARRQGEVMARAASVRQGWEQVAGALQTEHKVKGATATNEEELTQVAEAFVPASEPAVRAVTAALEADQGAAAELKSATQLLAAAFLALVASGPDQPLGRLNFTRFLLLQGEITTADAKIRRIGQAGDKMMREVIGRHVEVTGLALSAAHATAGPELAALDRHLAEQRVGEPVSDGLLGTSTLDAFDRSITDGGLKSLQAKDALLRMLYLDLRRER